MGRRSRRTWSLPIPRLPASSSSPTAETARPRIPCALGTLAAGATRTVTTTFAVPSTYTTPDPIVNVASVTSDTPDPATGNNTAQASVALNGAGRQPDDHQIRWHVERRPGPHHDLHHHGRQHGPEQRDRRPRDRSGHTRPERLHLDVQRKRRRELRRGQRRRRTGHDGEPAGGDQRDLPADRDDRGRRPRRR